VRAAPSARKRSGKTPRSRLVGEHARRLARGEVSAALPRLKEDHPSPFAPCDLRDFQCATASLLECRRASSRRKALSHKGRGIHCGADRSPIPGGKTSRRICITSST
jgi:hypothetical protein